MNREKEQERVRKEKQKERSLRKETEKLNEAAASLSKNSSLCDPKTFFIFKVV